MRGLRKGMGRGLREGGVKSGAGRGLEGRERGGGGKHLEVLIDRPSGSALMLIHGSQLSQAEAEGHGVADVDINPNQLPSHGSVVQLRC